MRKNIYKSKNFASSKDVLKKKTIGKLKEVPFRKMAPNIVTLMALCSGVTTIKFAILGNWTYAIACIFLACVFDGLDGRVARKLKASSKFGAEALTILLYAFIFCIILSLFEFIKQFLP